MISISAYADFYDVPILEAKWEAKSGKGYCYLSQTIPNYGRAVFSQKSGAKLSFSIQENRSKPRIIKADLVAKPAPWQHKSLNMQIFPVYLEGSRVAKHHHRLVVYGNAAEAMIDALLNGDAPTFTYVRAVSDLDMNEIQVSVSPVRFMEMYEAFSNCRNKLVPSRSQT